MATTDIDPAVRDAVTDVLVAYATGIDRRDWTGLEACFTEDCDADYGDTGRFQGGAALARRMAEIHDPLGPTMHRLTNIALTRVGEGIHTRAYVHVVVVTPDGAGVVHVHGWYDDELAPVGGGWRIARRRFTSVATELHQPLS